MHAPHLVFGLGLAAALLSGTAGAQSPTATARLVDANGVEVGTAVFAPGDHGVQISGRVTGLAPGAHGMHIHTQGSCEGPDFMSAGGHFNPHARKHGLANPEGAHAGDVPNLMVAGDGNARIGAFAHGVTLDGDGPDSLFKDGGTALVLHAGPDDEMSDPAGNSGGRIACGPIVAGPIALPRAGELDAMPSAGLVAGILVMAAGVLTRRLIRKGNRHGNAAHRN
jgi:Cu-Zn family superoxide dismutase